MRLEGGEGFVAMAEGCGGVCDRGTADFDAFLLDVDYPIVRDAGSRVKFGFDGAIKSERGV